MSILISSTSNPKVKDIVQLLTKSRVRKSKGLCVIEGEREIQRALASKWIPSEIWMLDGSSVAIDSSCFPDVYVASQKVFDKIAYRSTTEWAIAVFHTPDVSLEASRDVLDRAKAVLILEGIEKPGNLGAVLRSAVAVGIDAVLLANPAIDPFGPNVIRNATGALFEIPLFVGDSKTIQGHLKMHSFESYITHMHSESSSMYDIKWSSKTALILGEESRGLTMEWTEKGYHNIIIPMEGTSIDSLNVSVAAAVLMYQWKGSLLV
mgnify:FL=1